MPVDNNKSQEFDLDSTDRLPILEGVQIDEDVADDAVRLDFAPAVPSVKSDFPRPSGLDLPSLAESVRSVEERIARQSAEYEALSRSFEKAREAEAAAVSRANELAADLASVRGILESEQARTRETEKTLAEKHAAAEAMRLRLEEAVREAERYQSESRTLRDTLAARDATIVEVLHSLGERDEQLNALQREHSQLLPALDERSRVGAQLEADLLAARTRSESTSADLKRAQADVTALTLRLIAREDELSSTRREVNDIKTQAASYLEHLRTREWRRGFDENLYQELDAQIGSVQNERGALEYERDRLRARVIEMEAKLAARDAAISTLNAAAADGEAMRSQHQLQLQQSEALRADLSKQIASLESERNRLNGELAARDESIAKLKAAATDGEAARSQHQLQLQQSEALRADLGKQIASLESERNRLNGELAVRNESIAKLKAAAAADDAARAERQLTLQQMQRAAADLSAQIAALESERSRLNGELAIKDKALADAQLAGQTEVQRSRELAAAAQSQHAELAAQMEALRSEMQKREEEMSALLSHLQEARRPIDLIEADVKRLTEELAAKALTLEQLNEENRSLRAALERARGALEEREFLIRRLERSESNNANVLGRIQTSIERLGAGGIAGIAGNAGNAAAPVECSAELVRVDGQHNTTHVIGRRTRIGRAAGCELQIESSSVSRHHALLLMGSRDVIIEDLNSTNGVLVNGRKVSRQLLNDGDMLTIGEAQFRLNLKLTPRTLEAPAATPP